MWRMKVTVVTVVVLGALLFGAAVAYAGWGWNAKVNIEGTMVSTSWSVDGAKATDYKATIMLEVPADADVTIIKVAHRREFLNVMVDNSLVCSDGLVNARATYVVNGEGDGTGVSVSIDRVSGKHNYVSGTGDIGEPIVLEFAVPGDCTG